MANELSNGFDDSGLPAEVRGKLTNLEFRIKRRLESTAKQILEYGEDLHAGQELLAEYGKGSFGSWVESRFPFARSTAYNYIQAWQTFGDCPTVGQMEPTAMYRLANPETPKLALNAAKKMAEKGQVVTAKVAEELIKKYTHEAPKEERTKEAPQPAADTENRTDSGGGNLLDAVREEEETEQPELSMADRVEADNKAIEAYCREVLKVFTDHAPDNPWFAERGLWNSALAGIKSALNTVRNAKQVVCPACDDGQYKGADCVYCKGHGGLPKTMADVIPAEMCR